MGSLVSADALRRLFVYRLDVDGVSKSKSRSSVFDGAIAQALRSSSKRLENSCFTRAGECVGGGSVMVVSFVLGGQIQLFLLHQCSH